MINRVLWMTVMALSLAACAGKPAQVDYEGCGSRLLFWAIGPKPEQPYLDVCYTQLAASEVNAAFDYVPIPGINQDTRQALDNNQDGISGNGQHYQDKIHWGGGGCAKYARRIVQKNCAQLGNATRTGGCEWVALQITPKAGVKEGYVTLTPVSRVRLPDGSEQDNYARSFTTGFSNCP